MARTLLELEDRTEPNGWAWYWCWVDESGVEHEGRTDRRGQGLFERTMDRRVLDSEAWRQVCGSLQFELAADYHAAKRKLIRRYGLVDGTRES